jgi:hypothetical protein
MSETLNGVQSTSMRSKLRTSAKKTSTNKGRFSEIENEGGNSVEMNNENIKRYPMGSMVEIINQNNDWFLAMGVNRISPVFKSAEDLTKWQEADIIELICSIALTITTVLINNEKK